MLSLGYLHTDALNFLHLCWVDNLSQCLLRNARAFKKEAESVIEPLQGIALDQCALYLCLAIQCHLQLCNVCNSSSCGIPNRGHHDTESMGR
jgi:hypothetical protein